MKARLSRYETLDEIFAHLGLANYSISERKVVYDYDPAIAEYDYSKDRKEMSFYFHSTRSEVQEAFAKKFQTYYPESLVTDDLKKFKRLKRRQYAILDAYEMWDEEAIPKIKEVFAALTPKESGVLVVLVKHDLISYNREFRWNFLGLHGLWYEIEGLPTGEVLIVLDRRSDEELYHRANEEYNGYPSFHVYAIATHLSMDEGFTRKLSIITKRELRSELEYEKFSLQVGQFIDFFVNTRGTETGETFYYSPQVKKGVIDHFYEEVYQERKILVTLATK